MAFEWSDGEAPVREEVLRIAREQINRAAATAVDGVKSAERRVHEARRRSKRLRGLFRLIRSDFHEYREAWNAVRDAAAHLSDARDTSVMRDTLGDLYEWLELPLPELTPPDVQDAARVERVLGEFATAMHRLDKQSRDWRVGGIDSDSIARGLRQTYHRADEARALAADKLTDLHFHEWRKLAKYHWHHLTLFKPCADAVLGSAHEAAGKLGDLLGHHHDLAVLREGLREAPSMFGDRLDTEFVRAAAQRRQFGLGTEALLLGDQVFAEAPQAFSDRMMSYLKAWRRERRAAAE